MTCRSVAGPAGVLALVTLLCLFPTRSEAIPAFARQANLQCPACHSQPPELNVYGRRFMLYGYTFRGGKPTNLPASLLMFNSHTSLAEDLPQGIGDGNDTNDKLMVQQVSLFAGGRFTQTAGGIVSVDYDGLNDNLSIGNVDIRQLFNRRMSDSDVLFGIGLNNNPGFQDPWNSSSQRPWPFVGSSFEPRGNAVLLDGALRLKVNGLGGYALIDDRYYVELTAYQPLGFSSQRTLGVQDRHGLQADATGIYARAVREIPLDMSNVSFGLTYFETDTAIEGSDLADGMRDVAVDAIYQKLKGPNHYSLAGNLAFESIDSGDKAGAGAADRSSNDMRRLRLSASMFWQNRVGVGLGYSQLKTSTDSLWFGTPSGTADTTYFRFDSFLNLISRPLQFYPYGRSRVGVQYTHFTEFNGSKGNIDGAGRDAADNNTLALYWGLSF